MSAGVVYGKTCEECRHIAVEKDLRGIERWARCFAPGEKQGYTVSTLNGHYLPYIPAWCPKRNGKAPPDRRL